MQHQLKPGALLDEQGVLKEAGYATRLVKTYDRSAIRGGKLRIKEWDYYCIVGGDIVLALTIADNSYMSLDSVSLLNLQTGFQHAARLASIAGSDDNLHPARTLHGRESARNTALK